MKICTKCKEEKDESLFYKCHVFKDGLHHKCKKCHIEYDQFLKNKLKNKLIPESKKCSFCKKIKKSDNFHKKTKSSDGLRSECIECTRGQEKKYRLANPSSEFIRKLKNNYNLNYEDYLNMIKQQNYKCDICLKKTKLVIDHNHITGKIRGLLCKTCNTGIGMLKDNSKLLLKAKEYLEKYD